MTTQTLLKHIVKQGERWDNLSYQYYGNALEYGRIIDANPHISFCEVLPTGVTIYIPVLNVKPTSNENMPPWLRGTNE
ncbi:tail protein X [Bisgaard Taxon 10/6]|uniref:Tail protein X n=1 Tax=Exercitatus varius TaxID=67857 RepID=A0AAW6Q6Z8_9PAST|nr:MULTISPECIES: tail protein X [Pasteurellaceae]MDD7568287.1 tail protein X [[Actinobacillus] rossii]MDG2949300.1 tail protein X [Exercitatus varius]MDG2959889.1 tail protein X [Exercitatus varius]MDY5792852.1 tail protein X [[Actinobacillus] rossii]